MDTTSIRQSATGALLAVLAFILVASAFPAPVTAASSGSPYFSFTMMAPNTNPVRVQWAEIIQNSYQQHGIDAALVFTSFGPLTDRIWPTTCPAGGCGQLFDAGGYDAIFIGWGGGSVLPDWGTTNVVNYLGNNPAADFPNVGNNYAYFNNATYNTLAGEYATSFDVNQREALAKQMVTIVAQERPYLVIIGGLGATPDNPVAPYVLPWNQQSTWNTALTGNDFQHWKLTGGNTVINVGMSGDVSCQYNLPIAACNSQYNNWLTSGAFASLEELDPRTLNYYDALATHIVSSADHLNWTISFLPHTFQDGVQVTANDYIFNYMFNMIGAITSVQLGTLQGEFGLSTQYTYNLGNGTTTDYILNGTYYGTHKPAGFTPTATFTFVNSTAFSFTMPAPYPFTDPSLTGISAFPMHVMLGFVSNPSSFANSWAVTLNSAPTTVTWNTAIFGGSGSYSTFGLYGDGAYVWQGYDKIARVGTYVKWGNNYWNSSGLEALGEYTAQTVHINVVSGKDSALAAFKAGTLNALDSNYQFDKSDAQAVSDAGGVNIFMNAPNNGWQELGLNLHDPIFGTGTGTPLGQSNPSQADYAAKMVRKAMSYLIPRDQIVQQLLQGLGVVGVTQFCTCFPTYMPSGLAADPYDPTQALSFLAAAGYNTGVAPPSPGESSGSGSITITIPNSTLTVPAFILGNSFTLSGHYAPLPGPQMAASGGFGVVLEQSTDGGTTWTGVASTFADPGGYFSFTYAPTVTGNLQYRLFYTGVNASYAFAKAISGPGQLEALVPPTNPYSGQWKNSTDTYYGPVSNFQVGSLGEIVTQLASGAQISSLASQLQTALNQLNSQLSGLSTSVNNAAPKSGLDTANANIASLQDSVSTLTTVAYAAVAVAIVLGLIAIALSMRKRS